ncbi:Ig-like domain-containing protein [Rubripirellula reticaptiva]|uniref:Uncharacterized protein n=1 Tax=Rubripirellula reticaptiva TaxID=2528013 RepID=A0A5C6F5L6_9BACT|nr:carboxypeptidase regulatory-like domain-containing protein [Rubripirellula reticaptiva]TWU56282.1 hypothetical protein Poly59_25860 [Rubripirellula reticaptiva]
MRNSNDLIERPSHDAKLKDWRSAQTGSRSLLREKIVLSAILFVVTGGFLIAVWRPLVTPQLCVISIGPKPSVESSDPSEISAQQMAIDSLQQFQTFARSMPTSRVVETHSLSDSKSFLGQDEIATQPRIIHVAGVASVVNDRPTLSPAESESGMRPESLDLLEMVRVLADADSPSIVLVDAIENQSDSVGRLPEITAWHFSRSIDREISQMQNAKVLVITHHTQVRRTLTPADKNFVSPLTQLAIDGFGGAADANANGVISVAEWLDVVNPVADDGHQASVTHVFSTTLRSKWKHVALAPVQKSDAKSDAKPGQDGETAVVAKDAETRPESTKHDTTLPEPDTHYDVTAPTLAVAIEMMASGIGTNRSDKAAEVDSQLHSLLSADTAQTVAEKWMESPTITAAPWDEVTWMRTVMPVDVPWSLKQDLIQCRVLANRLAIDRVPREWFADAWQNLQWNRLDAERSLLSPVRSDNTTFVSEQVKASLRGYVKIQQDVTAINEAMQICADIHKNVNSLVVLPIHAQTPKDDGVCQLLRDTLDLQAWLDGRMGSNMNRCTALIQSIQKRRLRLAGGWARSDGSAGEAIEVMPVTGLDNSFIEKTRTRIARSSLAAQVLLAGDSRSQDVLLRLTRDSETAIAALSSSSYSEEEIISAVDKFKQSIDDLDLDSQLSTTVVGAADASDADVRLARSLRWSWILHSLASDTRDLAADSTQTEREQLVKANSRYQRLALAMGLSTLPRLQSEYQFDVSVRGSMAMSDYVSVGVSVRSLSDSTLQGTLEVEFDGKWFQVDAVSDESTHLIQRMVGASAYQTVAAQRLEHPAPKLLPLSVPSATMEIHRSANSNQASQHGNSAVNVRWITRDDVYRAVVPLKMPLADIAEATLDNGTDSALASVPNGSAQWIMHANRDRFRHLWLKALTSQTQIVKVRLLAWAESPGELPPTMNKDQIQRWLSSQSVPFELAVHPGLPVNEVEPAKVTFLPAKLDPLAAPVTVASLWCEVTDEDCDAVQMIDLGPCVYRPAALIRPVVAFDHNLQRVDVSIQSLDGVDASTHVRVELFDVVSNRIMASGDMMVPPGTQANKSYSAAGCDGRAFGVRVLTDQWPSAFVFHVAGDRSEVAIAPSDTDASVTIRTPDSDSDQFIVPKGADVVDANVWVDLSDSKFRYGSDQLTLGIDLNGDRYLDEEPSVTVSTPTAIKFAWAGVNATGALGLHSQVEPHRLSVPVGLVKDRRAPLIASLQRGAQMIWSNALTGVFDAQAPKVKDVQFQSPLPSVLGKPVVVRVVVDDAGLSEAASIRAGWATAGQQEFTSDVKPLAGQRIGQGHWAIIAPTDALVSGTHTLLIQATDAAQNIGAVTTVAIEVRSEAEWITKQQSQSTAVRGKIAYVKLPVAGMKVALTRRTESKPDSPNEKPDNPTGKAVEEPSQASNLPQEVLTDAGGNFVIPDVKAGEYELTLEGLYRGMKYAKSVRVAVKPPQPSNVSTIRID